MSKFKDNIPGFPGYHVTKNGDVYSMKCRYEIGDITRYKLRTGLHKSMVKICVKYLRDLGYSWKDIRIALHLSRVAIEKYKKP